MAMSTVDLYVGPQDGWVLVATNPQYLRIKPNFAVPWSLAVTASGAPDTDGNAATGSINFSGQPNNGGTVTVGDITYTFVTAYNNPGPYDVKIGTNQAASQTALATAINGRAAIPAVAATGNVTISGGVPTATQTVTIGGEVFTFVALRSAPFQVTIGADATTTGDNLVTALTADSTFVDGVNAAGVVTLTAKTAGFAGNSITLSETATNVTVSGATMTGGNDLAPAIAANSQASGNSSGSNVNLTALWNGMSGNNIVLSENATNVAVTAFSGGADELLGQTYGNDEFKKFEAYEFDNLWGTPLTGEFYVKVSNASSNYNQGRVRFGIIKG